MSESVNWAEVGPLAQSAVETWHRGLADDRRDRARLRRAQGVDDVFEIDAYHRLRFGLARAGAGSWAAGNPTILGRVALAVAAIDADTGVSGDGACPTLGAALAGLSKARLRLIANTGEIELFLRLLRGAMSMIHRSAPVWDTAETVRRWHHPDGRRTARRLLLINYNDKLVE
ncbi:MAG: hypothetical protein F8N37_15420 [Telmatospirillum sp.]|nr:hypothetical protein [Telmatospirillum sp.]